jgi:hypothetical protein
MKNIKSPCLQEGFCLITDRNKLFVMITSLGLRLDFLKLQIELEESNYKYAVELQKDHNTLSRMRENIRRLKEELQILSEENHKGTSAE